MAKTANLFIFLEIFEREGGIQSYVQDILHGYSTLAHQPQADVFLLRDGTGCQNPLQVSSLKFHYLKTSPPALGRLRLAIALLLYLLRERPQRVFCGHMNLAPLVQMLCRPLGIPYTVITYGKEVWFPLPPAPRRALHHADQIWTISRYSRDAACASNQLNPHQIQMLPCPVDGDRFTPGAKSPVLLERYGLTGARVLMTVARLWSGDIYKGVDVTIRALPAIAAVFPDVKYLVIGRGDDQPRLANLAHELGVADRVVFAGFVPTADLPEHYRLAEAYVMPSQEGFGIVYLEAMACGIPVLSGDADGSSEPLQDGKLGWQVPHRDPVAVTRACIEMLKGREICRTAPESNECDRRCDGQWLRQQSIALFGKEAFVQRLNQIFVSYPDRNPIKKA
ncbi:glycosyltransferase family 4 protein [Oculatella sp. LEGE 06141]|uniref:glycosyltransferase family 4 protein n=1 Tax=Oculatella sp. LEGE 06141 TaxID=1828648 RepID=UPI00187E7515|nr:glycosyltransferase family 4 protein [Oculatella sp. LEGE 06141]MBE9177993.1 glycosyltransferase family 4 protein [Oculatella sp. LEGE 06141]